MKGNNNKGNNTHNSKIVLQFILIKNIVHSINVYNLNTHLKYLPLYNSIEL